MGSLSLAYYHIVQVNSVNAQDGCPLKYTPFKNTHVHHFYYSSREIQQELIMAIDIKLLILFKYNNIQIYLLK